MGVKLRRADGFYAVEFALVLLVFVPLAFAVGEVCRVALADHALARATHQAALAAGRNPATCQNTAETRFQGDLVASWLFDGNDDGSIGFVIGAEPDGSANSEVRLDINADDGDVANGVTFDQTLCGTPGSWIRVRAATRVRWPFTGGVMLRQESWAVNQT